MIAAHPSEEGWNGLMVLFAVIYSVSGSAISSGSLSDVVTVRKNDSILVVFLTIKECTLIVRPRTEINIILSRKHAAFITPCRVYTNEGTAVYFEQIVRKIQRKLCVILDSNSDKVFIA